MITRLLARCYFRTNEYPNLAAYHARGEARPAYRRAFEAQLAVNTDKTP